jgi:AcrR family transcriptional regulator
MATAPRQRLTREERRALTRTRLLDSAEEVFAERGFHGTSLEEVAERAGYTRGAVYWNFSDKDELFAGVIERRSQERITAIAELRRSHSGSRSFLDALRELDAAPGPETDRWHLLAIEQMAYALRNPEMRARIADRERAINNEMGAQAAAVYAELHASPPLPEQHLGVVIHALDWGLRLQHQLDPAAAPPHLLHDVLELLLDRTADNSTDQPAGRA